MRNNNFLYLYFISTLLFSSPSNIMAEQKDALLTNKGEWCYKTDSSALFESFKGASWIWMKDSSDDLVLFRKKFNISTTPKQAVLSITASDHYRLYINGKYVSFGPARTAAHHQSFDCIDVTPYLQQGENLVAVRAIFNEGRTSYQNPERAGFLCALSCDGRNVMASDNSWKVAVDPTWKTIGRTNNFQLFKNESVDFRHSIGDWTSVKFDDSCWSSPELLVRNEGWPTVQKNAPASFLATPWTSLVKRDIPYLSETDIKAVDLLTCFTEADKENKNNLWDLSGGINNNLLKNYKSYRKGTKDLTVALPGNNQSVVLIFDMQEMETAMGKLSINGQAGTRVNIQYAPFVIGNRFNKLVAKNNLEDELILSGRGYDEWVGMSYKPTRYLALKISGPASVVNINWAGMHSFHYPFKEQGVITSADGTWVDDYMQSTEKTIRHCTTDAFTDNYREKRQYAQTGYYGSLGNYYTFSDFSLQRRYLLHTAYEQNPNGIMPAYGPSSQGDYMVILDSNCLWIRSLYNYYLYSGDRVTTESLLSSAKRLVSLLISFTDKNGLIVEPPYAYWLDHANLDRRGANFLLNFHFCNAISDYAKLLKMLGKESQVYSKLSALTRESLLSLFWNEEKGLFVDAYVNGIQSSMYSEHANGTALCLMDATDSRVKRVAAKLMENPEKHDYVTRDNGLIMVTPAMSYFFHKGLCHQGYIDESFSMFRQRFDKMLNYGNHTLWEEWWLDGSGRSGKFVKMLTRSDAQTESSFFPALAAEYLVGFSPLTPGLQNVSLSYVKTQLKEVEAKIPTTYGNIEIQRKMKGVNTGHIQLNIPEGVTLQLNLTTFPSAIIVDGNKIDKHKQVHKLNTGLHLIEF